jgi:RND family efflux transporter MFP subunit
VSDLNRDLASLKIDRERQIRRLPRWPLLLFLPVILAMAALYAWQGRVALGGVKVEAGRATLLTVPTPGDSGPLLTATGYVVPRRKAVVSAKIQGRLAELRVEEGSRVAEGETIARLESSNYQAQIDLSRAAVRRAEADLAESRRRAKLAEELAGKEVLSQDELDARRSQVTIDEAELAQARAQVRLDEAHFRDTVIRAPFSGVVLKKMAEVGESVAPIPPGVNISTSSGAIVALADLDTLEVEADVSESNVARLGDQQPAVVSVEAFPERKFRAVLRQIIPTADRTRATVQVKVTILDKDPALRPEMTAKVNFYRDAAGATAVSQAPPPTVTIPPEALVTRGGQSIVFEIVAGRARSRAVRAGGQWEDRVEVSDGLTGSEQLVLHPPEDLEDGDLVRVEE